MRAVVVYESMFGNTHEVADHVAEGLRSRHEVVIVPVGDATPEVVGAADYLVVGGPTHVHGLSSSASRKSAAEMAGKEPGLELDDGASGPGLRDWLEGLPSGHVHAAAAFDTRADAPAMLTGRASKGIAKRLARHGYRVIADPESFLVDKQNHLLPGEAERATKWGVELAAMLAATPS